MIAGTQRSIPAPGLVFVVNFCRIDESLGYNLYTFWCDFSKEAGPIPFVAGGADLFDFQQDRIGVAVDENLAYALTVPALFPFSPQAVAASAEINGVPGRLRLGKAFGVHPGYHKHLARVGVLGYRWQNALASGEIGNGGRCVSHDCRF